MTRKGQSLSYKYVHFPENWSFPEPQSHLENDQLKARFSGRTLALTSSELGVLLPALLLHEDTVDAFGIQNSTVRNGPDSQQHPLLANLA